MALAPEDHAALVAASPKSPTAVAALRQMLLARNVAAGPPSFYQGPPLAPGPRRDFPEGSRLDPGGVPYGAPYTGPASPGGTYREGQPDVERFRSGVPNNAPVSGPLITFAKPGGGGLIQEPEAATGFILHPQGYFGPGGTFPFAPHGVPQSEDARVLMLRKLLLEHREADPVVLA